MGLLACLGLGAFASPASAEPALPPGFQDTVVFGDLDQPTAFRFAPDGRIFVAEKSGEIEVYDSLSDNHPEVFADLRTKVYDHGDRGLLGLALDPDFSSGRPYVYVLYTYDHILGEDGVPPPKWGEPGKSGDSCPDLKGADDCLVSGRLVRLTAAEGEDHAVEQGGAPLEELLAEDWCQQFSSHSIGDLQFGPEGALYASGGDGASFTGADYGQFGEPPNPCDDPPGGKGTKLTPPSAEGGSLRAQNLENLSGKIIRVDPDSGEGLADNPMASSSNPDTRRIVAYGFRNPFRFTIDPQSGEIYTDNVGSSEIEEIDRFAAPPSVAYNSGWPCYEGPVHQFLFAPLNLTVCKKLYEADPGSTSPPFFYYSHAQEVVPGDECPVESGSALGGIAFYEGGSYPPVYDGALFFTDAVRGCIYVMFPGEDGRPDPFMATRFFREAQVYPGVDIEVGPDGSLYYASLFGDEEGGPGAIHRISYDPGAPTARLSADPQWGEEPFTVDLDASQSSDPDEEALEYEWDLDGDGTFEANGEATRELKFDEPEGEGEEPPEEGEEESENWVVAVRVSDGHGSSSVARVTIYPNDAPPEASIDAPGTALTWQVGQKIHFEGSAVDYEGDGLPALNFKWTMRLAHCPNGPESCHKHPLQTFAGVSEGSFIAPEHDYPSYIEINLRVADYRGLTTSKTIRIDPKTVDLAIGSDPAGAPLTAGLKAAAAPFSLTAIKGSNVVLSAPEEFEQGGTRYAWSDWSDAGARVHAIVANAAGEYVASFKALKEPSGGGQTPGQGPPVLPVPKALPSPPAVSIRAHPPGKTQSKTARYVFSSTQAGTSFKCKLDKGSYKVCRSPQVYKHLKPGPHSFAVVAIVAGVQGKPAKFSWKVLRPKAS